MIRPIIDIEATIGNKFMLIEPIEDWRDYQNNTKVLGSILTVGVVEKFDRITVKIPILKENIDIEVGDFIEFSNLRGTPYIRNNYINISFKADNVVRFKGEVSLFA